MSQTKTIRIEGWRRLPHSYSISSSFKMLELLRRPNIHLSHADVPYFAPHWQPVKGMFDAAWEAAIASIPTPASDEKPDAIYRIAFPYNFAPSGAPRTAVFGTAEFGMVPDSNVAGGKSLPDAMSESDCVAVTCSEWSRNGYVHSGADPSRVFNIGLGVEPALFHPVDADERAAIRKQMGINAFSFLNLGAMSGNKGIPLLLKAFAQVALKHPQVHLVTKGLGALYDSRTLFQQAAADLTQAEAALIQDRLHFVDTTLAFADIARMYQAMDAYVTPYYAEGFSMPALEAAACGMPVICTKGGATDDFTRPDFALHIDSTIQGVTTPEGEPRTVLMPNLDHLIQHMMRVVEDPSFAAQAHQAGPAFVSANFTWKQIVDRLLAVLFPEENRTS